MHSVLPSGITCIIFRIADDQYWHSKTLYLLSFDIFHWCRRPSIYRIRNMDNDNCLPLTAATDSFVQQCSTWPPSPSTESAEKGCSEPRGNQCQVPAFSRWWTVVTMVNNKVYKLRIRRTYQLYGCIHGSRLLCLSPSLPGCELLSIGILWKPMFGLVSSECVTSAISWLYPFLGTALLPPTW